MATSRGRFNNRELEFIKKNSKTMSVDRIAKTLGRRKVAVMDLLTKQGIYYKITVSERSTDNELTMHLKNKPYWGEIQKQFLGDERKYFINMWVDLIRQFKGDVMATEEYQIKQLITTEIMFNRIMKMRNECLAGVNENTKKVKAELDKTKPNEVKVNNLKAFIAQNKSEYKDCMSDYEQLSKRIKDLYKDLKATRDQRLKKAEDGKSSWAGLMKILSEEEGLGEEGDELGMAKLGMRKEENHLAQYHQYVDGSIDQPLLTPETVLEED